MINIEKLVRPVMEIKRGEWEKTLLTFLYFYLTITAYYILKPARNTLFISYLGANNLPYVYMTIAVISYFLSSVYTKYSSKLDNNKLVTISLVISILSLLLFRWAFHFEMSWFVPIVSFLFYVWVTLFSILTVTQFWVLANDVFDSRAAKRLYGFVGSGGILGGMTGGFIAGHAKQISTENLLLIASGYIVIMILLFNYIWIREKNNFIPDKKEAVANNLNKRESWNLFAQSKYLLYVLGVVALMKIVTVQTEWQYNRFVELSFEHKDDMTAFFGNVLFDLSIVALIIQLLFTSRVLKRFGFNKALIPLPLGLFIGSVAILFNPVLLAASILKISEGSLRYSINQTAKEYLYLPIERHIRYKIKPFIDVCVYQFAKGFGALFLMIYLLLMSNVFHASDILQAKGISYVNLAFLICWFFVIYFLKKEYPKKIRHFLKSEEDKVEDKKLVNRSFIKEFLNKIRNKGFKDLDTLFNKSQNHAINVRMAVCVALYEGMQDKQGLKELLQEMIKGEDDSLIGHADVETKTQDTVDNLIERLKSQDSIKRYITIKRLNKLREENHALDFDKDLLLDEVFQEIDDYYKTFAVYSFYGFLNKENGSIKDENDDFLSVALKNLLVENIERIFRLLGLLYNPIDVYIIYKGLMKENIFIRANSLELLDEILQHKPLKKKLFPLLDGEISIFGPTRARSITAKMTVRDEALHSAMKSGDKWLCLCAMYMIDKFKIKELYHDVKTLTKSEEMLCKKTAQFLVSKLAL